MGELTCDPNDPRLGHGVDAEKVPQNKAYLIDCDTSKGFIRPVRKTYVHVGTKVRGTVRPLTPEEKKKIDGLVTDGKVYVAIDEFKIGDNYAGSYLTDVEFGKIKEGRYGGCGCATTMSLQIAETYARNPHFYGSTYCMGCSKHLPVSEFVWDGTNETVGS